MRKGVNNGVRDVRDARDARDAAHKLDRCMYLLWLSDRPFGDPG